VRIDRLPVTLYEFRRARGSIASDTLANCEHPRIVV